MIINSLASKNSFPLFLCISIRRTYITAQHQHTICTHAALTIGLSLVLIHGETRYHNSPTRGRWWVLDRWSACCTLPSNHGFIYPKLLPRNTGHFPAPEKESSVEASRRTGRKHEKHQRKAPMKWWHTSNNKNNDHDLTQILIFLALCLQTP